MTISGGNHMAVDDPAIATNTWAQNQTSGLPATGRFRSGDVQMTYVIAQPCIDVIDIECVDVCPVDCIHPTDGEGVEQLYIDPDECIDCGACEPECPVEAIFVEEDLPEEWVHFTKINADYFIK